MEGWVRARYCQESGIRGFSSLKWILFRPALGRYSLDLLLTGETTTLSNASSRNARARNQTIAQGARSAYLARYHDKLGSKSIVIISVTVLEFYFPKYSLNILPLTRFFIVSLGSSHSSLVKSVRTLLPALTPSVGI
jgi:hypothetical protein